MSLPSVVVISLGGTIAMSGENGATPALTGDELIAAVPGLGGLATVEAVNFRLLPGASLRLDDIDELAAEIERRLDAGADGVVITQGTDTIEETAFYLDLQLDRTEPVVVTGAMRNASLPGADGPANLFAAVVVAGSRLDLGGVVVVLDDQVHSARAVAKTHSTLPSAFASPGCGPIGLVAEGRAHLSVVPVRRWPRIRRAAPGAPPRSVPIVTIGLDDDGATLAAADRADAVVLDALGVGHVPQWLVEPITRHAERIPVVMTSRTRTGPVLRQTYGFPGSERDLRERGVLSCGLLNALKARILLLALLRSGMNRAEMVDYMTEID